MKVRKRHIRLYFISIVVGISIGFVLMPYRYAIHKSLALRDYVFTHEHAVWFHLIAVAIMILLGWLVYMLSHRIKDLEGSGIPQVNGYINGRFQCLHPFRNMLFKLIGSTLGIGMGYSLGSEGPSVQSGAYVGSAWSKWLKVNQSDTRFLIISGAAAGLAALFTAPLTSTVFASESIAKYQSPKIILTVLLAAIPSGWIATYFFPTNPYAIISSAWPSQYFFSFLVPILVVMAFLMALCGRLFNALIIFFQRKVNAIKIHPLIKIAFVAIVTYLLGHEFTSLISDGEPVIYQYSTRSGDVGILFLSFLLKIVLTAFTYSLGLPGGIFLPILVIGALGGELFTVVMCELGFPFASYSGFFMLISIAALFTATVHSPITALILIPEMTGHFNMFLPMIVLIGITFFFTRILGGNPVYDLLYKEMLPPNHNDSSIKIVNHYELYENSTLIGVPINQVTLPLGTTIVGVMRDDVSIVDFSVPLALGDMMQISIDSPVLEDIHLALMSLCKY